MSRCECTGGVFEGVGIGSLGGGGGGGRGHLFFFGKHFYFIKYIRVPSVHSMENNLYFYNLVFTE